MFSANFRTLSLISFPELILNNSSSFSGLKFGFFLAFSNKSRSNAPLIIIHPKGIISLQLYKYF